MATIAMESGWDHPAYSACSIGYAVASIRRSISNFKHAELTFKIQDRCIFCRSSLGRSSISNFSRSRSSISNFSRSLGLLNRNLKQNVQSFELRNPFQIPRDFTLRVYVFLVRCFQQTDEFTLGWLIFFRNNFNLGWPTFFRNRIY